MCSDNLIKKLDLNYNFMFKDIIFCLLNIIYKDILRKSNITDIMRAQK